MTKTTTSRETRTYRLHSRGGTARTLHLTSEQAAVLFGFTDDEATDLGYTTLDRWNVRVQDWTPMLAWSTGGFAYDTHHTFAL